MPYISQTTAMLLGFSAMGICFFINRLVVAVNETRDRLKDQAHSLACVTAALEERGFLRNVDVSITDALKDGRVEVTRARSL